MSWLDWFLFAVSLSGLFVAGMAAGALIVRVRRPESPRAERTAYVHTHEHQHQFSDHEKAIYNDEVMAQAGHLGPVHRL